MNFPDEVYRDVCSIKTLYSTDEGFFKEFVDIMLEKVDGDWLLKEFSKQTSDEDRIRICCNDHEVWSAMQHVLKNVDKVYRKKSAEAANDCQLQGDKLCQENEFKKAVMFYSQSLIRAPPSGDETNENVLPLAYKSRANALMNLGYYNEALTDLKMATKERYPDALKYQIYKEMGKCYKNLGEANKARISLQISLKLINEKISYLNTNMGNLSPKKDNLLKVLNKEKKDINEIMNRLTQIDVNVIPRKVKYVSETLPKITGTTNERYPDASHLIKVVQSREAGRFAVAADKISTGDTLVVEEPQASLLIPKMLSSHCLHCFTRLFAPIPCSVCSGVAFCSEKCHDAAMASYHKYECQFLGLFMGSGMTVLPHLALRMVTQENLEFFKRLHSKIKASQSGADSSDSLEFTPSETRYLRVYNLVTNSHLRTHTDYFRRVLMAIFLVKCLRKADYFGPETSKADLDRFSEDEILTASIILHHLQLLQFNAHEIYETRITEPWQPRDSKTVYIAVGIYPTVALFNHECTPSVTRYFNGKNIVIKAVRPLGIDEILSENYGPHYAKRNYRERERELTSRYWFQCRCPACEKVWPLIENTTQDDTIIRCSTPNCKGSFSYRTVKKASDTTPICLSCLKKTDVMHSLEKKSKIQTLFDDGLEFMEMDDCSAAVSLLTAYLDKLHEVCVPPCREIFLAQEALRTCYARTGNVWLLND